MWRWRAPHPSTLRAGSRGHRLQLCDSGSQARPRTAEERGSGHEQCECSPADECQDRAREVHPTKEYQGDDCDQVEQLRQQLRQVELPEQSKPAKACLMIICVLLISTAATQIWENRMMDVG